MQHSETAVEMLRACLRSETILPYDDEGVRVVQREIRAIYSDVQHTVREKGRELNTPYIAANVLVHHAAVAREKRAILAYLRHRTRQIERLRWELDADIPDSLLGNLSQAEKTFLVRYDALLTAYNNVVGLDLTVDFQQPPRQRLIEVRVLRDCQYTPAAKPGQPEPSPVELKARTKMFLRRSDVEPLIRTGYLEHVTD